MSALSFFVFSVSLFFQLDSAGRQFPLSDSHSSSFRTARIREKIVFSASRWRSLRAVQLFGCFPAGQGSAACELLFVSAVQFFLLFSGHTGLLGLGGYASPPLVSYGQLVLFRFYLGTN